MLSAADPLENKGLHDFRDDREDREDILGKCMRKLSIPALRARLRQTSSRARAHIRGPGNILPMLPIVPERDQHADFFGLCPGPRPRIIIPERASILPIIPEVATETGEGVKGRDLA